MDLEPTTEWPEPGPAKTAPSAEGRWRLIQVVLSAHDADTEQVTKRRKVSRMPERPGPWELLDKPSDPVVADLPEVDARLAYFRSIAETMTTEGQRLSQIASGESLTGEVR